MFHPLREVWRVLHTPEQDSRLTSSLLLEFLCSLGRPSCLLFLLLFLSAPVKVLHHDSDKHVQHEEANQQQEGDEVEEPPLGVVLNRLTEKRGVDLATFLDFFIYLRFLPEKRQLTGDDKNKSVEKEAC